MRRLAPAVLALVLAGGAARGEDAKSFPPPVPDEAHGMTGSDRATALAVLRSHYENLLAPLALTGLDRKDPARAASCEVRVAIDPARLRPGAFVDGLPVRRAQPLVFNEFQQQTTAGLSRCAAAIAFTSETWRDVESQALALVLKNSGTTFCRRDDDCYATEIRDRCEARPPLVALGSNSTDAVFFVAYRKFLPGLMTYVEQLANGAAAERGLAPTPRSCPMEHWAERPLDAVCARNACRTAP